MVSGKKIKKIKKKISLKMKDLTIIIPLFNQYNYLHQLLLSLCKSVTAEQIVVMDDKSNDQSTIDYLSKIKQFGIKVYRNRKNLGFGGNCNKGIILAKTKYIALINSDISIPQNEYPLEHTYKLIQDQKNGIIGIRLMQDYKINHGGVYMDWNDRGGTPRHRYCGDKPQEYMKAIETLDFVTAAFWMLRRKDFIDLGGFYEGYGKGYFEDPDFCVQMLLTGKKIIYDGTCYANHAGHVSFKAIKFPYWNTPENLELFQKRCIHKLLQHTKKRIGIYTAISGIIDQFRAQPLQNIDHQFYRFEGLKSLTKPVLIAKHPKVFFWKYLKEDITIWVDGNIQIISDNFAKFLIDELGNNDILTLNIEGRNTLQEEVAKLRENQKHNELPLEGQINHYYKNGLKDYNLYGCGILVRRNNEKVRQLMKEWWIEIEKWGYRDQISFPYTYFKNKNKPKIKILDINKIRKYCTWIEHLS